MVVVLVVVMVVMVVGVSWLSLPCLTTPLLPVSKLLRVNNSMCVFIADFLGYELSLFAKSLYLIALVLIPCELDDWIIKAREWLLERGQGKAGQGRGEEVKSGE